MNNTNYIAAYGPEGPLYLLKTKTKNQYWVIGKNYTLNINDLNFTKYNLIRDNFSAYAYETAHKLIEKLYDKYKVYPEISEYTVQPFNSAYDNNAHIKMQKLHEHTFAKVKMTDEEMQALKMCKHFKVDTKELELNVAKQFINMGYKPETKMPLPDNNIQTNIVVTDTIHTVNGEDVKHLDDDTLLYNITLLENSIATLKKVKSKSKFVEKTIKKQTKTLKVVIKHLDARV